MKNKDGKQELFNYPFFIKNKKGNFLTENVVFIILNSLFLILVALFIFKQGSGAVLLEQSYAKNIALLIDSGKPGMEIILEMEDAFKLAEKNNLDRSEIVKIKGNKVVVKLSSDGGYEYSFFNDVSVSTYPDDIEKMSYIIKINEYNNENI